MNRRTVLITVGALVTAGVVAIVLRGWGTAPATPVASGNDRVAVVVPGGLAPAAPVPAPVTTSTTSTVPPVSPATVAASFARAYLGAPPDGRRAACRPYDTDALDTQLAGATWAGPGPGVAGPTQPATVTLRTLNAAEVTRGGIGYEISATVTAGAAPSTSSSQVLQVWVSQISAGVWLADVAPTPTDS